MTGQRKRRTAVVMTALATFENDVRNFLGPGELCSDGFMGPSDRRADPAHDDKVTINRGQARHSVCGERGPCLPDSRSLLSPLDGKTCWRASLDRFCLRPHAAEARYHRYGTGAGQQQPKKAGKHRIVGMGNPAG